MDKLLKVWNWLNGQKTAIGASIIALLIFAQQSGVHLPLSIDQLKTTGHDVSMAIGAAITFIGLAHKVIKGIMDIVGAFKKVPAK